MGLLRRQNLGFSRVSRVRTRVTVWIRASVGLKLRFSISGAKLQETRRSGTGRGKVVGFTANRTFV